MGSASFDLHLKSVPLTPWEERSPGAVVGEVGVGWVS